MSASRERKRRQTKVEAPLTEREKQEAKQSKTLKLQTILFSTVCILMVLVVAVFAILNTGIVEKAATALTVGTHKISAAEMNYFYVNEAYAYYNNNSSYMSYFIDSSKPVNKQVLDASTGSTWADNFLQMATNTARDTYALYDAAVAAGYTLTEEDQASIDNAITSLDGYAKLSGASNANAYLRGIFGRGCNVKSYRHYLTVQQTASSYATSYREGITYTDEELAAFEAEDALAYNSYDYRMLYLSAQSFYESDEPTDEEKAAALTKAEEAANGLAKFAGDEEGYLKKAAAVHELTASDTESEYDADSSTLRENILRDNVTEAIRSWITDASRKAGDCEVVPVYSTAEGEEDTVVGYYVPYFLGSTDNTDVYTKNVRHILISDTSDAGKTKAEELLAKFEENPTEDNFAALAEENSQDTGTAADGGLYEAVPGMSVANFNDWCFDESRKPGDYGIVDTEYGYHLIYMIGDNTTYRQYMITSGYTAHVYEDWYKGVTDPYTADSRFGMNWVHTGIYLGNNNSSNS